MLENFLMIAEQVAVLFILIAVGFILGKKNMITDVSAHHMTDIVLYAVTPCVMISAFQREFSFELLGGILTAAGCACAIFAVSILLCRLIVRDKDKSRQTVMRFAAVYSNCGFMSLPLQKAILGDDGWFYGSIMVAVFNIFIWTHGLVAMSGDKKQLSFKKLIFNPGIVGVIAALALFIFRIDLPSIISTPIDYLAALNTPLPMLIIGFYLSQANFKKAFASLSVYKTAAVRLLVIPLLANTAMWLCGVDKTVTIAFAIAVSAPTAATTTMFSAKFNRGAELSVSIVAATTVLSIITMPLVVALAEVMVG